MKIVVGAQNTNVSTEMRGELEGEPSGDGIKMNFFVQEVKSSQPTEINNFPLPFGIFIELSSRGALRDLGVTQGPTNQPLINQVKELFGQAFPMYPEHGVVHGDRLMEMNINFGNAGLTSHATVLGKTNYLGRQALVVEYGGSMMLLNQSIPVNGYSLIDTDTGVSVYSDMKVSGNIVHHQDEKVLYEIVEIKEIKLPAASEGSSDYSSQNSPISEGIEDRLSRLKGLLDQGLISEEDAAEKRKEILGGL
jgi:hypothetical protein